MNLNVKEKHTFEIIDKIVIGNMTRKKSNV